MAGYTEETFEGAWYKWQRDAFQHLYTIFEEIGVRGLPPRDKFRYVTLKGQPAWHDGGYHHLHFDPFLPLHVKLTPIETVTLDRKPEKAAERVFINKGSEPAEHNYTYTRGEERTKTQSTRNMQGLELTQEFSVGGEGYGVKVESKTSLSVKAEFEQGYERGRSESQSEEDSATITVPPGKRVDVHTEKWSSRVKEIEQKEVHGDLGFRLHAHSDRNPSSNILYHSPDYKKTGKYARRLCRFKSFSDLEAFLEGRNPRYSTQRDNLLKRNKRIRDNFHWLKANCVFTVKEETIFNDASYGDFVIEESNA